MVKTSISQQKPIAITMGDPAGIGPDVIIGALEQIEPDNFPPIVIVGNGAILKARATLLGRQTQYQQIAKSLIFEETQNPMVSAAGAANPENAAAIIEAIETAVAGCANGKYGAIVTAPINKKVLYNAGFDFPGHTEFLAHLVGRHDFGLPKNATPTPVMMIAGPELRTIPVTIHIALSEVPAQLTKEKIVETATITHRDLIAKFGIAAPVLAISGLNPHAGEEGAMGKEDQKIIAPAIEALKSNGIDARGPYPADTMFHERARKSYDAAICMYHDQALIPAKTLAFDEGINVTLGLPFIRTSPDHGTAYEIAGTGKARPDSFIAALNMAAQMMIKTIGTST